MNCSQGASYARFQLSMAEEFSLRKLDSPATQSLFMQKINEVTPSNYYWFTDNCRSSGETDWAIRSDHKYSYCHHKWKLSPHPQVPLMLGLLKTNSLANLCSI